MPLDGNGLYSPPPVIFPVVATEIIYAADFNAIIADIASALSSVIYRDGQAAMTAALPMGTKRITGMGDGIADTDAVTKGQMDAIAGGVIFDIPSGTPMVFYQAAAPAGWTQSTAHNDKALRVVAGAGGGSGGTHGLTVPPSLAHTHAETVHVHGGPSHTHGGQTGETQLVESQIPSHTHTYTYTVPGDGGGTSASSTGNTGGNGTHSHTGGGTTASGTGNTTASAASNVSTVTPDSFLPKYIDVIICVKD